MKPLFARKGSFEIVDPGTATAAAFGCADNTPMALNASVKDSIRKVQVFKTISDTSGSF